jgi:hypothetical protein
MKHIVRLTLVALGAAALAGCVETTDSSDAGATPFISDPNGVEVRACRAAIARAANISVDDVAVYDAPGSEAGTRVMATIAGATDPWTCLSDRNGNVSDVRFTGSEGFL